MTVLLVQHLSCCGFLTNVFQPPLSSNSLRSSRDCTTWYTVQNTWFRLQPGCSLVFGEAVNTASLRPNRLLKQGERYENPADFTPILHAVTWRLFPRIGDMSAHVTVLI